MNSEHVEVLRDLSEVCRAAIKAGDWKVDGACDPDAALRRADAAIASLSAPQPPAEAQAQGGGEPVGEIVPTYEPICSVVSMYASDLPVGTKLYAAPPSAPVGVDGWVVETVEDDPNLLVINTPNKRSWIAQRGDRVFELAEALALAQQPAAGVGEEIMVNAAHDVYTLPLQPSGLSSGPRFVVHVPGPEQPAAVDGAMVRKVAKAINAEMEGTDDVGGAWKRLGSNERGLRDRMARAALAAQQGDSND